MSHQESDLSRLIQLCSKGKIIKPKSWAGIYINQWELQWISRLEKGVFVLNWICSLGTFCQEGFCGDSINTNCSCCSVAKWCLAFCDPMDCSMPGFPVLYFLLAFAQTHVHWVSNAVQPSHPLLPPSLPALNLSQHQVLFQWVSSLHQVAKVLALQLQRQSFQWIFRVDFL